MVPVRAMRRRDWSPALIFVLGFAALIMVGGIFLTLPFASATGERTPLLTALFTATSAVCLTGLVVVDTATHWSGLGQAIILVLIQLGGFGFMTSSTLILMLIGHRVSLRERILLREALAAESLEQIVGLVRRVFIFTVICESIGVVVLTLAFLREVETPRAMWWGLFHAVSSFNNAGFDLVGGFRSMVPFNQQPFVLLPLAALLIMGSLSFVVVDDLFRNRRVSRLALDSKMVLAATLALICAGTIAMLFTERANAATLGAMEPAPRLLNAFFMAVTPRSAGFNSVDVAAMTENGLVAIIALMFVGGAAGSTAGGIKVQTFSLLFFAIVSAVRGATEVEAFHRRIPTQIVLRAIAVALLAISAALVVSFALSTLERAPYLNILFETISALSTTGLSTGITPNLHPVSQVIIMGAMFAGRLGPLTLVIALAARRRRTSFRWSEAGVRIG
jgi:trk system potassium uptake protein TrkH